ncbi:TonB-dependent hemoglobin/transferrin/lactoferrin family receptor [Bartonella bovis]|uniref:Outer membrane hemin receptor n=1 Tax=Bartonella bovis m02 TaxID=1094492 RepID=N6VJL0_9HYPH|nr:TonB-dependent hemoglobin/transferrin/lactoferrin family receptor [Bartonella bovis]ENN93401.1 outer membrane hemin receptor [Bartonella bovis m02]
MQTKPKSVYKSCIALSALSIWLPSFVFAQNNNIILSQNSDPNAIIGLKSIVIEKGKTVNPLDTVTILTDRETAQDIEQKQINDVHDIGRLNPSITYNSNNDSFVIRGLDADRVLVTIDGIPLPWLNDGVRGIKGGSSMFDFNALSTLDIIRGSDSSRYGSGALSGIVALRTLDPEDLLTEEKNWGNLTKGSYNSADNSWHIDEAFAVRAYQTFLLFQGSRAGGHERKNMGTVDVYGSERTRANPADFDQNNLLFKIYQYFNSNHKVGFTAERFYYNKDTHSLNASSTTYSPSSVYNKNNKYRERFSLSYDYSGNGDAIFDAFQGQLYWQKLSNNQVLKGHRIKPPQGDYVRDNLIRNINYGFNTNSLKKFDTGAINHALKFSTDIFASKLHQYASGQDNCHLRENARGCAFLHTNQSDTPDTHSHGFSLAFEDEIGFSNNHVRITPGIRYDWYKHVPQKTPSYKKIAVSKEQPKTNGGSHFSPKLRIEWDANDQVTFYSQWAQAFRAPSVSELYLTYINPTFYYTTGNPNLKPEISNGYDIGIKYGNVNFDGSISVFTNQYKNFIDIIDKGPSQEFMLARRHYINRAHVRISGVETKTYLALNENFHSNFSFAYAQGKDLDKNEYLNSIPALKAIIGVGYAQEVWGADIMLTLAAKRDKVEKDSDYAKTPSYSLVDVLGWWEPFGEKGPIIRVGIYNLFNKKYWNATDLPSTSPSGVAPPPKDYFSQPGRNFKVSLVQKF